MHGPIAELEIEVVGAGEIVGRERRWRKQGDEGEKS